MTPDARPDAAPGRSFSDFFGSNIPESVLGRMVLAAVYAVGCVYLDAAFGIFGIGEYGWPQKLVVTMLDALVLAGIMSIVRRRALRIAGGNLRIISRAPGAILERWAPVVASPQSIERIAAPMITDMRNEIFDALVQGRRGLATAIHVRGIVCIWWALRKEVGWLVALIGFITTALWRIVG